MTTAKVDQDMRDLLIRLDQKVGDGFKNINEKLDNMERRADAHETRIRQLENDSQTRLGYVSRFEAVETKVQLHEGRFQQLEGAGKGFGFGWKALTAGVGFAGILIGLVGSLGLKLMSIPDKPVTNAPQIVVTDK